MQDAEHVNTTTRAASRTTSMNSHAAECAAQSETSASAALLRGAHNPGCVPGNRRVIARTPPFPRDKS